MKEGKVKVLMVEDENLAAIKLLRMIHSLRPNFHVVEQVDSVEELQQALEKEKFDLIFSDIQLSDGLCFSAFSLFSDLPPIIFCTAFDEFAIQAFKFSGIDYLLKPIDEKELIISIEKFEKQVSRKNIQAVSKYIEQEHNQSYKTNFLSKLGKQLDLISEENIDLFYSENKLVFALCENGNNYLVDYTLQDLEEVLNPKKFFRINRQTIIHRKIVSKLNSTTSSRLNIVFKDKKDINTTVSKTKTPFFKKWLKT